MSDMRLDFDDFGDVCPICKEIVEIESWPRILSCGEGLDDPEVVRREKPPPCPVCDSKELEMNWLTVPNKRQRGMTHNLILSCPSCGVGHFHDGFDALTGRIKMVGRFPPQWDFDQAVQDVGMASDTESRKRAEKHKEECLHLRAFFRVHSFPCLDDGWDNLGYGLRPLERTEIMERFYIWTNREAVGEAGAEDNPLRKPKKMPRKRGWW